MFPFVIMYVAVRVVLADEFVVRPHLLRIIRLFLNNVGQSCLIALCFGSLSYCC